MQRGRVKEAEAAAHRDYSGCSEAVTPGWLPLPWRTHQVTHAVFHLRPSTGIHQLRCDVTSSVKHHHYDQGLWIHLWCGQLLCCVEQPAYAIWCAGYHIYHGVIMTLSMLLQSVKAGPASAMKIALLVLHDAPSSWLMR